MEEININKVEWVVEEYEHKERTADWYWTIGLLTVAIFIVAIYFKSYLFSIFVIISGASLSLFSFLHPQEITYIIETEGLSMGKDNYEWTKIKGFDIKKRKGQNKLLIELDKYFLPVYTIPLPDEIVSEVKESLSKVIPLIDLRESKSMLFAEKLGF